MGAKFQKKSNCCKFKRKEQASLDSAVNAIEMHIPITPCGTFTVRDIAITTVGMAIKRLSPTEICKLPDLKLPSSTTFRTCANTIDYETLIENNPSLFQEYASQFIKPGRFYTYAIDEVNDPYYGEIVPENEDFIVGGKQKKSTNYFYSYISLYVTVRNRRVTLAVFPVRNSISKLTYIRQFIEIIRNLECGINVLLLDRGFFSGEIFNFLKNEQIPHIMPVKVLGEKMKALLAHKEVLEFKYTLNLGTEEAEEITVRRYTTSICNKNGKFQRKNLGFVIFGINWNIEKIKSTYSHRFAIESSYRMRNAVKPKTSTRNPVIRYFFAIISFLLKNIWVVILFENFRKKQHGPIVIISEWFRFDAFRERMWNVIARKVSTYMKNYKY